MTNKILIGVIIAGILAAGGILVSQTLLNSEEPEQQVANQLTQETQKQAEKILKTLSRTKQTFKQRPPKIHRKQMVGKATP